MLPLRETVKIVRVRGSISLRSGTYSLIIFQSKLFCLSLIFRIHGDIFLPVP